MLARLLGKEYQRKLALSKAPPGVLRNYLSRPFPGRRTECSDVGIAAVDLETTGLDPRKDDILSIGMVEIHGLRIKLSTAWHTIIAVEQDIPAASAVIHQITDDHAAVAGRRLEEVLPQLLARLGGKVMLVHYARIEQQFLDAACRRLYGTPFIIPVIDTLVLAQRVFERQNHSIQTGDLRLFNLRPRYNLPRYKAHNALSDALSTAELFLAMAAEMAPGRHCRLGNFLTG